MMKHYQILLRHICVAVVVFMFSNHHMHTLLLNSPLSLLFPTQFCGQNHRSELK